MIIDLSNDWVLAAVFVLVTFAAVGLYVFIENIIFGRRDGW